MILGDSSLLAIFILLVLFLLPGYAVWSAAGPRLHPRVTAAEAVFLMLTTSIVIVSWLGMLLAELELFSLPLLLGLILATSSIALGWAVRKRHSLNPTGGMPSGWPAFLALAVASITLLLSPQPYQYIVGGRDHGVYVNTGIHIAKSGGILIYDNDLREAPALSRQSLVWPEVSLNTSGFPGPWSGGQRLSGLTIRDLDEGVIVPHAFHLYPVWIAIFFAAGGISFALATTMVFSFLGVMGIFFAAARLLGWPTALLGLFFLSINVSQVWYSQYPSAEIMVRFFIWSGLFAFALLLSSRNQFLATLAGFCFGLLHLAKLDTVFVPVALLTLFLYLWLTQRFQREYWFFVIPYLALLLHTAVHAFYVATIYFIDQATRVLLPSFLSKALIQAAAGVQYPADILNRLFVQSWPLLSAMFLAAGGILLVGYRYNRGIGERLRMLERWATFGKGFLAISLGLLAAGAFWSYPEAQIPWLSRAGWSLSMSSWYLAPLGLFLGMIGMLQSWITYSGKRSSKAMTFGLPFLLVNLLPLFIFGAGTAPDHFWAIRRFIPVVFPTMLLFAAHLLWELRPSQASNWGHALFPAGLAIVFIFLTWQNTKPAVGTVEYDGLVGQVATFADQFADSSVLLFEKSDASVRIATPLWLIFDKTVFAIETGMLDNAGLKTAVDQWRSAGRDVYWISTSGQLVPNLDAYAADYMSTSEIAAPLFEMPRDRIPADVGSFRAALDTYLLVPHTESKRQVTTVSLTQPSLEQPAYSGIYAPFRLPGLTPTIWTAGKVKMNIPFVDHPEKLLLRLESGRPPAIPLPSVDVHLNGIFLGAIPVSNGKAIYELLIPTSASFSDENAELSLEMDAWIPSQSGHGSDPRELGVHLDWVKLITQ